MTQKKWFFPALLAGLFIIFILLTVPEGSVYGSYTDWLSQHVSLAETIRSACIEQGTLTPAFLPLGGGSNGYQFAYYGFLRPDIVVGCLLPEIPMVYLVTAYMLAGYLSAVLLCYYWLGLHFRTCPARFPMAGSLAEGTYSVRIATFFGSILFMAADCFFHTHRQVMFINYMPFLLLALIAVRKKRNRLLPLFLFMIYVNSFYYSIACLVVIGWYWLRQEGSAFWKHGFLSFLKSTFLSIGMAALLLLPTALVILEHRRASDSLSLPEICGISLNLQSILYSPYGMGLTAVCLYALLLGLTHKKYRLDSIFLLVMSTWCLAAWLMNGTLYTRTKILIPFVPLVILHCTRIFYELLGNARQDNGILKRNSEAGNEPDTPLRWRLWPCLMIAATLPFWAWHKNFIWIAADIVILTCVVLVFCLARKHDVRQLRSLPAYILLCLMPCMLFLQTTQEDDFVKKEDIMKQERFLDSDSANHSGLLYRYDSLNDTLNMGNLAASGDLQKSAMYSSVTNHEYSDVYYETLQTPVQINNRLAVLPSANPFLLHFLGVRFLETTADNIPDGYHAVSLDDGSGNSGGSGNGGDSGNSRNSGKEETVTAENPNVLPIAYLTDSCISETQFESLDSFGKLDAMTRYTVVGRDGNGPADGKVLGSDVAFDEVKSYFPTFKKAAIPDSIHIERTKTGLMLDVKKTADLTLTLEEPLKDQILLLDFDVKNDSSKAVVIDINHIRNKLSGSTAPYPNGNDTFRYQFSDSRGEGLDTLNITLSKGKYMLNNISWHTYSKQLLGQKKYTPVEKQKETGSEILSCTGVAKDDCYFVTSIPLQKGMEILVDGKTVPIVEVNQAFAGARIEKGAHDIRIAFSAPGQKAGYLLSFISFLIYLVPAALWCLRAAYISVFHNPAPADMQVRADIQVKADIHLRKKVLHMKGKKELLCYCISGGATTFVNYVIYFVLLEGNVEYLTANTFAWIGAVLTAYIMNRKWVFRSSGHILQEFCSFFFLRFLTLLTENVLLWTTVGMLGMPPLLSKILVSIITVLTNYVLCKYKIFHKEGLNHG